MAIVFTKQKRSQKILIIASVLAIIVSIIIFWQGFLKKESPYVPEEVFFLPPKEISINFEALERVKEFQLFIEIEPFKEEIGRENPFLPY